MANIQDRQQRQLEQILQLPGNNVCADCKAPSPRWASINLSIFLCITCASIHRSLGTHTSRIKSLTLDTWTREMVETMRKGGNVKGNDEWWPVEVRERFPIPLSTVGEMGGREGEMERFIRRKYEEGAFRVDRVRPVRDGEETIKRKPVNTINDRPKRNERDLYGYTATNSLLIPTAIGGYNNNNASPVSPDDDYSYQNHIQAMAGPSSSGAFVAGTGKKTSKTARAHVDANWADFMDAADDQALTSGSSKSRGKGTGKKAGRLLGMRFSDSDEGPDPVDRLYAGTGMGGPVRLPPVTKAPKGLAYKSASKPPPPPPPPPKKKEKEQLDVKDAGGTGRSLVNGNGVQTAAAAAATAALIDVTQPYQAPPLQPTPSQSQPGPQNSYNPFLGMNNNPYQTQQQQQFQPQYQRQMQPLPSQMQQQQQGYMFPQTMSYGAQMQPGIGIGMGMMQGNGTMISTNGYQYPQQQQQQYQPTLPPQQQMYTGQQHMTAPPSGYVNVQGAGAMGYGQTQQMQQGQNPMQMSHMQGQGMMGWQ